MLVDGRPSRFGAVALAHRRKRAALSGVLRELTLQQGFMLAQIVEEIPARGGDGGDIDAGNGGGDDFSLPDSVDAVSVGS